MGGCLCIRGACLRTDLQHRFNLTILWKCGCSKHETFILQCLVCLVQLHECMRDACCFSVMFWGKFRVRLWLYVVEWVLYSCMHSIFSNDSSTVFLAFTLCVAVVDFYPVRCNNPECIIWSYYSFTFFFSIWHLQPLGVLASLLLLRLHDHTQGHTTVGRTPLDKWSARRRDLYLTTHTTLTTDKHPCPRRDSNPQS